MKSTACSPCILAIYSFPKLEVPSHKSPCNTAGHNVLPNTNVYIEEASSLSGFLNLREEKNIILISKIKALIIDLICSSTEELEVNFSQYLSSRLNYEYAYLSTLFSKDQGITIERFMIEKRIDRIKDFLLSDKLTITKIALDMNYSSVAHLSNQFKKVTGFTPSQFKKNHHFA